MKMRSIHVHYQYFRNFPIVFRSINFIFQEADYV